MTRRRSGLSAAALACLVLVTGCGGEDQSPTGSPSLAQTEAPAAVAPAEFVRDVLAAVETRETVRAQITGSFLEASADIVYGAAEPASKIMASVYGGQQVIIAVDGTVYLQTSPGSDFSVVDASTPVLGPLVETLASLGPRDAVEGIGAAITSVEDLGTTTTEGAEVTEYEVTVDTARLTGALSLLAGSAGASEELAMTFFVDADGLPSAIEFDVSGEPVRVTFRDWNAPITVQAPR